MQTTAGVEERALPNNTGTGEQSRRETVEGLSRLLADTHTLYLKTHSFHWNVTGPMFYTLHLMFEGQYRELWEAGDQTPNVFARWASLRRVHTESFPNSLTCMRRKASPQPRR